MKKLAFILLGVAAIVFVAFLIVRAVFRIEVECQLVECESVSWHEDVALAREKIASLEQFLDSPRVSHREKARIRGLMGDLAMASGNKWDAAAHYTDELLSLLRASNPALYEKYKEDPTGLHAIIAPQSPPARLPAPLPFDASELTRHSPPEIPQDQNADQMRPSLPEILHGAELRKIAVAGPAGFHRNAERASILLKANEKAILAYRSLGDRYRLYHRPGNEDFMRLDVASGLFIVRLLAAWHTHDLPGVVENHKRVLQLTALAASDGGLAPVLCYLGNRGLLHQHIAALLHEGLGEQTAAAALLSNLREHPLDLLCLHPIAAREYVSRHTLIIGDLDTILTPGEGLAKVENFREHWIRYFEEDLYFRMSRFHGDLTATDRPTPIPVARKEELFAEAVHAVRPGIYQRFAHSGMTENEANLIRTHAACRLSAKTMNCIAVPDGKRIHAALRKLEENESLLVSNLENRIADVSLQDSRLGQ